MEVSKSHMNWGSDSSTLENSTMMVAADCDFAPLGYYQRLLLVEDMIPTHSDDAQVDYANVLQNQDDLEQLDWDRAPELDCEPPQQLNWEHANVLQNQDDLEQLDWDRAPELNWEPAQQLNWEHANVLQNQDDLEQLDWDRAPELNWEPAQQLKWEHANVLQNQDDLLDWEPAHQLNWEPSQELQCPSTSETIPEFPTVDQLEETIESGEEYESEDEDQPTECNGECSDDHVDESTGGLTLLPKLPSSKKIGVSYHKKNKQWEAHLWIKGQQLGQQLRGRKKKGAQIFLGNFETVEEAKLAHDRAAIKLKMQPNAKGEPYQLNFPAAVHASYMEEHAEWTLRDFLWKIRRTSNRFTKGKSKLKGVSVRTQSVKRGREWAAKYESKISITAKEFGDDMKRTFMLGNFESEEEAGQAYDRALLFLYQHLPEVEQLRCITNFRPSTYSASDIAAMASKLQ